MLADRELYSLNCSLLAKQIFYLCSCSQKNRSARHARQCSQRPFVTPSLEVRRSGLWAPDTPYSIGNSSRVILRIGIKLPRALRGCFVEVSHDLTPCKTCRAKGNESVKRSRASLNIEAKWVGAHLGKGNRWTLWEPVNIQCVKDFPVVLLAVYERGRAILF